MSASLAALRLPCCFTTLQLADKQLERAKHLISKRKREDVEAALIPLDCALELRPEWEVALELKARALLYLKRFKDVVDMLHEHVPSLQISPCMSSSTSPASTPHSADMPPLDSPCSYKEKTRLLSEYAGNNRAEILILSPFKHCFCVAKLRQKLSTSLCPSRLSLKKAEKQQQWRYLVLGQACCHLGMLEDAMSLLQRGKRSASDMSRKQSNGMREDNFCTEPGVRSTSIRSALSVESELVMQMLANIKFLLRRRAAAMAALEAGLYAESVRHFSKIIDGRKGTPQGFIADCYLHRAIAYQATGRVVDAISDCNRSLVLSPHCSIQALSVRASLYEMVRCYSDCMLDLQQLKIIYEASLRYESMLPELTNAVTPASTWTMRQPHISHIDFAGGLEYINSKITSTRQRLSSGCSLDAHTILDMPKSCTMEDVERAYLLISLKHRADKATQFVERRDFVSPYDQRDPANVREEARASALRLSQLIHKAYMKLLSSIADQETEKKNEMMVSGELENDERRLSFGDFKRVQGGSRRRDMFTQRGKGRICNEQVTVKEETERESQGCCEERKDSRRGRIRGGEKRREESLMGCSNGEVSMQEVNGLHEGGGMVRGAEDETDGCDFCQPFGGFSSTALANALSQAMCSDLPLSSTWAPDWSLAHQSQPLPVT
eukprot:c22199_g1_i1 orf=7-2007(-)